MSSDKNIDAKTQLNKNLVAFKAITDFVSAISDEYGNKLKTLKLYSRLLKKTTFSHENAINKHVSLFRDFCVKNRNFIFSENLKDLNSLKEDTIKYSDNVYLNMKVILNLVSEDDRDIIKQHLLNISAILDPAGKAKEYLVSELKGGSTDRIGPIENNNNESNFLADIIGKVEQHVDPNSNPIEAITKMMSSGVFTDLMSGMKKNMDEGKLDMGKLLGSVQGMIGSMNGSSGSSGSGGSSNPGDMMDLLNGLMGGLNENK